eukprot:g11694.t1
MVDLRPAPGGNKPAPAGAGGSKIQLVSRATVESRTNRNHDAALEEIIPNRLLQPRDQDHRVGDADERVRGRSGDVTGSTPAVLKPKLAQSENGRPRGRSGSADKVVGPAARRYDPERNDRNKKAPGNVEGDLDRHRGGLGNKDRREHSKPDKDRQRRNGPGSSASSRKTVIDQHIPFAGPFPVLEKGDGSDESELDLAAFSSGKKKEGADRKGVVKAKAKSDGKSKAGTSVKKPTARTASSKDKDASGEQARKKQNKESSSKTKTKTAALVPAAAAVAKGRPPRSSEGSPARGRDGSKESKSGARSESSSGDSTGSSSSEEETERERAAKRRMARQQSDSASAAKNDKAAAENGKDKKGENLKTENKVKTSATSATSQKGGAAGAKQRRKPKSSEDDEESSRSSSDDDSDAGSSDLDRKKKKLANEKAAKQASSTTAAKAKGEKEPLPKQVSATSSANRAADKRRSDVDTKKAGTATKRHYNTNTELTEKKGGDSRDKQQAPKEPSSAAANKDSRDKQQARKRPRDDDRSQERGGGRSEKERKVAERRADRDEKSHKPSRVEREEVHISVPLVLDDGRGGGGAGGAARDRLSAGVRLTRKDGSPAKGVSPRNHNRPASPPFPGNASRKESKAAGHGNGSGNAKPDKEEFSGSEDSSEEDESSGSEEDQSPVLDGWTGPGAKDAKGGAAGTKPEKPDAEAKKPKKKASSKKRAPVTAAQRPEVPRGERDPSGGGGKKLSTARKRVPDEAVGKGGEQGEGGRVRIEIKTRHGEVLGGNYRGGADAARDRGRAEPREQLRGEHRVLSPPRKLNGHATTTTTAQIGRSRFLDGYTGPPKSRAGDSSEDNRFLSGYVGPNSDWKGGFSDRRDWRPAEHHERGGNTASRTDRSYTRFDTGDREARAAERPRETGETATQRDPAVPTRLRPLDAARRAKLFPSKSKENGGETNGEEINADDGEEKENDDRKNKEGKNNDQNMMNKDDDQDDGRANEEVGGGKGREDADLVATVVDVEEDFGDGDLEGQAYGGAVDVAEKRTVEGGEETRKAAVLKPPTSPKRRNNSGAEEDILSSSEEGG